MIETRLRFFTLSRSVREVSRMYGYEEDDVFVRMTWSPMSPGGSESQPGRGSACGSFPCCCWPLMKHCGLLRRMRGLGHARMSDRRLLAARSCSPLVSWLRNATRGSHWQLWDAGAGESRAGSLGGGSKPHIYITNHHQTMPLTAGQIGCSVRSREE